MKNKVTRSRSWCQSFASPEDKGSSGVRFTQGWVSGAHEVLWKGDVVAQTTDKWMADLILNRLKGNK